MRPAVNRKVVGSSPTPGASETASGPPEAVDVLARAAELDDVGLDAVRAERARDGGAMVAVAEVVPVADAVDRDRGQRRASLGREVELCPAAAAPVGWAEWWSKASALCGSVVPAIDATAIVWTPSRRRGAVVAQPVSSAR
jgi:hypothetical protein